MSSFTYITRQHQFDLAMTQISSASRIAVDTESSGFYTYYPELCLIQLSAEKYHFIVDPMVDLKLDRLGEIFADRSIIKIFHSASSDIMELRRANDWQFSTVFDTFIACKILGMESCSLASLVQQYLNISMKKTEQKSNWKKRPLTRSQLEYAHLDTAYLEVVMDRLKEDLNLKQKWDEYEEEVEISLAQERSVEKVQDPHAWARITGAENLDSEELGRLKVLYDYRDTVAKKKNITPFRILTNKTILDIARNNPSSEEELLKFVQSDPTRTGGRFDRLIQSMSEAAPFSPEELPEKEELDEPSRKLFYRLKKWRQNAAKKRNMDISVILSNRILKELARRRPVSLEELHSIDEMPVSKISRYGTDLARIIESFVKRNENQPADTP